MNAPANPEHQSLTRHCRTVAGTAIEATRAGAADFGLKPFRTNQILNALRTVCKWPSSGARISGCSTGR